MNLNNYIWTDIASVDINGKSLPELITHLRNLKKEADRNCIRNSQFTFKEYRLYSYGSGEVLQGTYLEKKTGCDIKKVNLNGEYTVEQLKQMIEDLNK